MSVEGDTPGSCAALGVLPRVLMALLMGLLAAVDPDDAARRAGPIGRGDDAEAAPLLGQKPPPMPVLRWLDGSR